MKVYRIENSQGKAFNGKKFVKKGKIYTSANGLPEVEGGIVKEYVLVEADVLASSVEMAAYEPKWVGHNGILQAGSFIPRASDPDDMLTPSDYL